VKLFVKNPNVTGNATNPNAPNPNVNLYVKIPHADHKLNVVNVMPMEPLLKELCFSKKLKMTLPVANAKIEIYLTKFTEISKFNKFFY
jgi:hypothetical protein